MCDFRQYHHELLDGARKRVDGRAVVVALAILLHYLGVAQQLVVDDKHGSSVQHDRLIEMLKTFSDIYQTKLM